MKTKDIIILVIIIAFAISGYLIFTSDWFNLWRAPRPEDLTSEQINSYFDEFLQAGIDKSEEGNCKQAILDFKKAIKVAPDAQPPRSNIAVCCIEMEDYKCAEKAYLEIIKLNYDPNTVKRLSELYKDKLNDPDKAIGILKSAYEAFPNFLDFSYSLGRLYMELGDKANAIKYFNIGLEIAPDDQNLKDLITELEK
ncbi:MAG: tetratricopeptide repeat protein [Patescibacteria group bacterium]